VRFFVAGLINVETTVAIDGFPLDYFPVRYPFYGLHTAVSGVGWNIARALTTLGDSVDFASLIGGDANGQLARQGLALAGIHDGLVLEALEATAQSVILYDPHGRRQIHVDLKDIQSQAYPTHLAEGAIRHCDLAVICNINFARPLLAVAQEAGKPIATDVHALSDLEDGYNGAFMGAATILFMSDESLPDTPEAVAEHLLGRYRAEIVVIGLGEQGACWLYGRTISSAASRRCALDRWSTRLAPGMRCSRLSWIAICGWAIRMQHCGQRRSLPHIRSVQRARQRVFDPR
jgi:acarbose 7IV-phosphotransferase